MSERTASADLKRRSDGAWEEGRKAGGTIHLMRVPPKYDGDYAVLLEEAWLNGYDYATSIARRRGRKPRVVDRRSN